jgi:uncharacterized protein (TIGR02594 family)
VSYTAALARVSELQTMITRAAAPAGANGAAFVQALSAATGAAPAAAPAGTVFPGLTSSTLPVTTTPALGALAPATSGTGSGAGMRALAVAQAEIGVAESPPGSNNSPRIATYRTATQGAYSGAPWCAYFVSWCARQAGAPIGEQGQGYGAVEQVAAWAQRTGRLVHDPQPGDFILFGGRHIGIVESVGAGGRLTTVEGNSSDQVARRTHDVSEATGFVRL